ncbi:MAG: hypothetical protein ACKOC5_13380 [Chloroflexota bacterium]
MKKTPALLILAVMLSLLLGACARTTAPNFAEIPAGKAFVDGETIFFSHTETSDPGVAELLTNMMKSPVLVVPQLAEIPDSVLAQVYVFQNGVAGSGPFKFQADVFPNQPGDPGYSPLRKVVLVKWVNEAEAKELKSEAEILDLQAQGKLTLEVSNIVVNMPFMTWKGGQR